MFTTLEAPHVQKKRRRSSWTIAGRVLLYLALVGGALIMLSPFAYMLSISFNPNSYTLPSPADVIPAHPTLNNYISAWTDANFGQAFFNSLIVACSATAITVLLSATLAFAFARYHFPGRNVLFYGMLATMTVPSIVLVIPQFVLASHLHLTNSRLGLILIYAAGMGFSV